jgi:uncharacterized membrane protein (UPF0127 family)
MVRLQRKVNDKAIFMSKNLYIIIRALTATALVVIIILGLQQDRKEVGESVSSEMHAYLQTDGRCVELDIAETEDEKQQGLSGRKELAANEGMLFTYEDQAKRGFWMKDMKFPIDIIWIDDENRVVTIKDSAQPDSYPETFAPDRPAKNVIETVAGFSNTENINPGDRLIIVGPTTTTPVGC